MFIAVPLENAAEAWFRNPRNYIRELAEEMATNIVFDRGLVRKYGIDPQVFVELHYPSQVEYRLLMVGEQGTAELRRGHGMSDPWAVYPTWDFMTSPMSALEDLLANPVGSNQHLCLDQSIPIDERPVWGQEHRVVVIRPPDFRTAQGKQVMHRLADLEDEYPDAIIHIHGMYSFRGAFGYVKSGDVDPRHAAAGGRLMLPVGNEVRWQRASEFAHWVHSMNMTLGDLHVPRNRCIFNIRAARWAATNFDGSGGWEKTEVKPHRYKTVHQRRRPLTGDKFSCDHCSLQKGCKLYRQGGICTLSDSEVSELASYFGTRDSDRIIDGLGKILEASADRATRGLDEEKITGKLDPEVTKILNNTFTNGVKLAKLVDPALAAAGATKVGIIINGQQTALANRPNQLTAAAVAALEAQGIAREDITPEMILAMMQDSAAIRVMAIEANSHE